MTLVTIQAAVGEVQAPLAQTPAQMVAMAAQEHYLHRQVLTMAAAAVVVA